MATLLSAMPHARGLERGSVHVEGALEIACERMMQNFNTIDLVAQ
jgi:hypothetical protein